MVLADSFYYQPVTLDTINTQVYTDLIAKEGDTNGRGIIVTLTENGLVKNTTGISLNLKWEHTSVDAQGLDNFDAVDLTKGIYKFTYPAEMNHQGFVKAYIQILDNGNIIGSRNIRITVESGVGDDTAITSSNSFTALASALLEVDGWNGRIDTVEADFIARANNLDATYPTRLLSAEQQLAQTSAIATVAAQKADAMASGSPKGVYATLALLQAAFPVGNTNVYVVSADGNWYYWSGSAWVSGGAYLSEVSVATNFELRKQTDGLLSLTRGIDFTWTDGVALLSTDGTTSTSGSYNAQNTGVSGFINVAGFTHVKCMPNRNYGFTVATVAFYDVSGVFVSAYTINIASSVYDSIPIPVGATQIKYSYYTDVRADALVLPRLSYIQLYNNVALGVKQVELSSAITKLSDRYVGSSNLFDKTTITVNKEIQPYTIADNLLKSYTDFIPIVTGESLYGVGYNSGAGAVVGYVYDVNKVKLNWISLNFSTNFKNTIAEANVAYVKFNVNNTDIDAFTVSKSVVTKYESFTQHDYKKVSGHNNLALNFWDGKNGDSLGDSLTGQGFFQKYVRQYFNLAKFSNHGIGGTKLSGPANAYGDSMWMDSRINTLEAEADVLTAMGGANDGLTPMGELTLENYDTNTIAGALNVMISKIHYKYQKLSVGYYTGITYTGVTQVTTAKNVMIFLCTPFYMPSETDPYRTKNIAHAIREIAKLWGLPVMDLAGKSMLNDGVKDVYWGTDRTHPLEIAHRDRIAPVMIGELEQFKPVDYTKAYYV